MRIISTCIFLLVSILSWSQNNNEQALFTIDGKPYSSEEFVRVYKKNLDLVKDESQRNVNQYLDLFINYKLKVTKAHQLGLHETAKYKSELQSYRNQLAKGYQTDKKVTEELVQEAYNRMKFEVKASHILIRSDLNDAPADTLKAYNKLLDIKKRIEKGEDFAILAQQHSEDPSAKTNGGNLGYFSAFKMVYPFESAAYNTRVHQVSEITRTRFGYHIIKVQDLRPTRGEIEVAHIMLFKPNDSIKEINSQKIFEIYKKFKQGENFETLAKTYSEDKGSSEKGGKLEIFGSGDIGSNIFEEKSFELVNSGDYTEPFESEFGFHIVKLIKKHPLKSLEELRKEIERKIGSDDRSIFIKKSFTEGLRSKYKIVENQKNVKKLATLVDDRFYDNKWELPKKEKELDVELFSLDKNKVSTKEFLEYLNAQQKSKNTNQIKPISELVKFHLSKFKDERLTLYHNQNLEKQYPEFDIVMNEYKEGILLFDLMEKEIWNKAKIDTIGLKSFYDLNKENYKWNDRYEVQIASSTDKKVIESVKKYLKSNKDEAFIKEKINKNNKINVMFENGVFEKGNPKLPMNYIFTKGLSEVILNDNYFYVINGKNFLPAEPKAFSEVKGKVISDYQQYLESNWIQQLKEEFKVEVNQSEFERIKQQL